MWKDWLERTLTRNNAPVMLAAEIMCVEPANGNEFGLPQPEKRAVAVEKLVDPLLEPVEAQ